MLELFVTEDGSHSIKVPELNVSYHSTHGAIQESAHIFIEKGLKFLNRKNIHILEVGFGTGLNALLTYIEAEKNDLQILYDVVELHPLDSVHVASLPSRYSRHSNVSPESISMNRLCNSSFMMP